MKTYEIKMNKNIEFRSIINHIIFDYYFVGSWNSLIIFRFIICLLFKKAKILWSKFIEFLED